MCAMPPSTHQPITRQFDPHYPSTQWTVSCDNSPLWHSYTYTIHPGIFRLPRLGGGRFVTSDMTSTLLKMLCDIMSTLPGAKCGHFVTGFFDMFVMGIISQTEQKSTNPWFSVPCALTLPNPGYGQSDRTEVLQPMNQYAVCLNLT
jgi:hypothetical protein